MKRGQRAVSSLNYPHMELPPEKDKPGSDAKPAAKPDANAPREKTEKGWCSSAPMAGPEFYKKYGGKTFFLRPVSSIRTKAPEKPPEKQPEQPAPTDKKE